MVIEKMERHYWNDGGGAVEYVLASVARAREDALLEALKDCLNSLDAYGFGGTLIDTQRTIVRQIEGSR